MSIQVNFEAYEKSIKNLALYAIHYGFDETEKEIFTEYIAICMSENIEPCIEVKNLNISTIEEEFFIEKYRLTAKRVFLVSVEGHYSKGINIDEFRKLVANDLLDQKIMKSEDFLDWDLLDANIESWESSESTLPSKIKFLKGTEASYVKATIMITLVKDREVLTDDELESKSNYLNGIPDMKVISPYVIVSTDTFVESEKA